MRRHWRSLSLVMALFLVGRFGLSQVGGQEIGGLQACTSTPSVLCLNNRFLVSFAWLVHEQNLGGFGTAVTLTSDTGYFWFNTASNVELVIKAVDGTAFNNFFWVFFGALTNVEYLITVTDTVTGRIRTYVSQQGQLRSVSDTAAFNASDGPAANANVAGIWDAAIDNPGSSTAAFVFTFSQTGTSVSGTFSSVDPTGPAGTVSGTISGQKFTFTATVNTGTGPCTIPGFLVVGGAGTLMRGAFPGTACVGGGFNILSANKR